MQNSQEWLAEVRLGPLRTALDGAIGPSLVVDLLLFVGCALALFAAARRATGSTRAAAGAALLWLVHPALGTAIPNDARGVLLTTLFAAGAVASAGGPSRVWGAAVPVGLLVAAALCGTPGAAPAAAALAFCFGRAGQRGAALTCALVGALDLGLRAAASEPRGGAATAGFLSLFPVARGYDLGAMGTWFAPWRDDGLDFVRQALEWVPVAVVFAASAAAPRARLFGGLWAGGVMALTFGSAPGDLLHDRAPALLAPWACVLVALLFDGAASRYRSASAGVAFAAVVLTFAVLFGSAFATARDADAYVERAVAAAPRSPVLNEAWGQILTARARRPGCPRDESRALLVKAATALTDGAQHAEGTRRFRMSALAADAFRQAGDFASAASAIRDASAVAQGVDERAELALLRFRWIRSQGDLPAAIECLRASSRELPDSAELRCQYLRAAADHLAPRLLAKDGAAETSPAMMALDAELEADLRADRPRAVRGAAHAARGRLALARGRAVEALRDFEEAKRVAPGLAEAYNGAAEAYLTQGILDGAQKELEAGLQATQPYPPAELLVTLAGVQLARGAEPRQVLELLRVARQGNPEEPRLPRSFAATWTAEADRRLEKSDLTAAEEAARAALEEAPGFAGAHASLGRVREQQKRHDDAAASFAEAFRLEPTAERRDALAAALKAAGMAALLNRDREKALKKFVELRDLGPVNVDLGSGLDLLREEARAEYNKAVDAKDPAVARPCLERSLHYLPENFYALYALGTLEAEAGGEEHVNDVKAIALWSRALAAAKEGGVDLSSFALHLNLAQAHYRRHEDDKARALLTEYLAFGKGAYAARCQALLEVLDVKRR